MANNFTTDITVYGKYDDLLDFRHCLLLKLSQHNELTTQDITRLPKFEQFYILDEQLDKDFCKIERSIASDIDCIQFDALATRRGPFPECWSFELSRKFSNTLLKVCISEDCVGYGTYFYHSGLCIKYNFELYGNQLLSDSFQQLL